MEEKNQKSRSSRRDLLQTTGAGIAATTIGISTWSTKASAGHKSKPHWNWNMSDSDEWSDPVVSLDQEAVQNAALVFHGADYITGDNWCNYTDYWEYHFSAGVAAVSLGDDDNDGEYDTTSNIWMDHYINIGSSSNYCDGGAFDISPNDIYHASITNPTELINTQFLDEVRDISDYTDLREAVNDSGRDAIDYWDSRPKGIDTAGVMLGMAGIVTSGMSWPLGASLGALSALDALSNENISWSDSGSNVEFRHEIGDWPSPVAFHYFDFDVQAPANTDMYFHLDTGIGTDKKDTWMHDAEISDTYNFNITIPSNPPESEINGSYTEPYVNTRMSSHYNEQRGNHT
ncbi:twin-arginine translocation signal domain-containing protein [Natrinema sp. CGMCC1.2065]|uniref:twin-arginine translocation signal domain-containing protein n=1 Tax=Natrinema sp. CGMCC1.2065 TaxID=3445767 RepID=UPI003F4A1F00